MEDFFAFMKSAASVGRDEVKKLEASLEEARASGDAAAIKFFEIALEEANDAVKALEGM